MQIIENHINQFDTSLYLIEGDLCNDPEWKAAITTCKKTSLLVWGNNKVSVQNKEFKPKIFLTRIHEISKYSETDLYNLVSSSYGCLSDYAVPKDKSIFHTLSRTELSIDRDYTKGQEIIEIPENLITIRPLKNKEEYAKIVSYDIKQQQTTVGYLCEQVLNFPN